MTDIAWTRVVEASMTSEAAFAAFYEENIHQLTRALTASLGDPQVAQDAAQESMARACERWKKVSSYDNPRAWCYRVAMNWATSRWRKRRREIVTDELPPPRLVTNPDFELEDRLLTALRRLSVDQRSVIVLRVIEDWSIKETAAALQVEPGTVQSRYARALARLRELVAEDE